MTQAPTPGPLSAEDARIEARAIELYSARFPGRPWAGRNTSRSYWRRKARESLAPTAPVEASGSERDEVEAEVLKAVFLGYEHGECEGEWEPAHGKEIAAATTDRILALRPQPSGETRSDFTPVVGLWKDQSLSRFDRVKAHNFEFGSDVRTAVRAVDEEASRQTLLSARPLALGGQHSGGEFNVEEYVADYEFRADGEGGCYTPNENERALLIDAIHGALSELSLSTTPARAEAQDPYAEGQAASEKTRGDEEDCPYAGGTDQRREWLNGFRGERRAEAQDEGAAGELIKELRLAACGLFSLKNESGDYGYFDSIADRVAALYPHPSPPSAAKEGEKS